VSTSILRTQSHTQQCVCIRFTPDTGEIAACGHATLATAHVLSSFPETAGIGLFTFQTLSGVIIATRHASGHFELDFPADDLVVVSGEDEKTRIENSVRSAVGGKARVLSIHHGHFPVDTIVELAMDEGVSLDKIDIDIASLVSYDCERLHTVVR
jgi:predicted PhzF superfamily epimerase YddE/YHI9